MERVHSYYRHHLLEKVVEYQLLVLEKRVERVLGDHRPEIEGRLLRTRRAGTRRQGHSVHRLFRRCGRRRRGERLVSERDLAVQAIFTGNDPRGDRLVCRLVPTSCLGGCAI